MVAVGNATQRPPSAAAGSATPRWSTTAQSSWTPYVKETFPAAKHILNPVVPPTQASAATPLPSYLSRPVAESTQTPIAELPVTSGTQTQIAAAGAVKAATDRQPPNAFASTQGPNNNKNNSSTKSGAAPVVLESQLNDIMRCDNLTSDDAVTTRERLRHQRRDEVARRFQASIPIRESRDPSHKVVCNVHHQQLDVAPSLPGHPLMENLVQGAYYEAEEPAPDLQYRPRGLGRRVESSFVPAPVDARPHTVAEQRRSHAAQLAHEREVLEAMLTAPRAGTGMCGIRPFPQDDAHDDWGRHVPRPASTSKSNISTLRLGQGPPPKPWGVVAPVPPIPGFDMTHPDQKSTREYPEHWHKPIIMQLPVPVEPLMTKDRTMNTDPIPPPAPRADPPAVSVNLPRPTSAAVERVAAWAPNNRGAPYTPYVRPTTAGVNVAPGSGVNPAAAGNPRYQHRPVDTVSRLF